MLLVLTVVLGLGLPAGRHRRRPGALPGPGRRLARRGTTGSVVGSSPDRPAFAGDPAYFQTRPSAAGDGYDPLAPRASNLGPSNPDLVKPVEERRRGRGRGSTAPPPADGPARRPDGQRLGARPAHQPGVRRAAGRPGRPGARPPRRQVRALVAEHTQGRTLGFLGEPRVNVLELNLALDRRSAGHWRRGDTSGPTTAAGRLRVYLGAAPGVGKTYAMLGEGHRRAERGTDVVVGFVETHGRPHTAEMLAGLEVVPRRTRDLPRDARSRRWTSTPCWPAGPGSRWSTSSRTPTCPARRNASAGRTSRSCSPPGIDVITTVNIQHLESLNDVVEKITGVPQRETVPDAVVRAADQIELVDMTAEALRRRLAHGNVYAPEKVDAALANYFRVGNLTALRELALLWMADRVDEALQHYREQHGIDRHLGDPGAGRRRAHRRPRGRDADPPGGPDRRPCRPAASCSPCTSPGPTGWPAPARRALAAQRQPGGEPRRHLPPGGRRRRARRRCWTSPGPRTPPSWCSAPAGGRGWRGCSRPGIGATTIRGSGDIDVHIVTHEQIGGGRRACPRSRQPQPRGAGSAGYALAVAAPAAADPVPGALPRRAQPGQRHAALPAGHRRRRAGRRVSAGAGRRGRRARCCSTTSSPRRCTRSPSPRPNNALALLVFVAGRPRWSARWSTSPPGAPARPPAAAAEAAHARRPWPAACCGGEDGAAALLERVRETFGLTLGRRCCETATGPALASRRSATRTRRAPRPERVRDDRRARAGERRAACSRCAGGSCAADDQRVLAAFAAQVASSLDRHRLRRGGRRGGSARRGRPDAHRAAGRRRPRPAHPARGGQGGGLEPAQPRRRRSAADDRDELLRHRRRVARPARRAGRQPARHEPAPGRRAGGQRPADRRRRGAWPRALDDLGDRPASRGPGRHPGRPARGARRPGPARAGRRQPGRQRAAVLPGRRRRRGSRPAPGRPGRAAGRRPRPRHPAEQTGERVFHPFQRLGDTDNTTGVGLGPGPVARPHRGDGRHARAGGHPGRRADHGAVACRPAPTTVRPPAPGLRGRAGARSRRDPSCWSSTTSRDPAGAGHQPARPRLRRAHRGHRRRGARDGGRRTRRTSSILDLGLPDIDGVEVIAGLRGWTAVPILVLSGRTDSADKVEALDAGADDYVTKPFGMDELLARMRAGAPRRRRAGRRCPSYESATSPSTSRPGGSAARRRPTDVRLTPTEWHLLEVLVRHPGKLLSQQQLLHEVWGPGYENGPRLPARSTWPSCAASSSPTRPARGTCSPSPAWATASSRTCPSWRRGSGMSAGSGRGSRRVRDVCGSRGGGVSYEVAATATSSHDVVRDVIRRGRHSDQNV